MIGKFRVALGFFVSLVLVLTGTVTSASAGGSVKSFSAVLIGPAQAAAGGTTTYTFQATNSTNSTNTIGSVQIAVPAGFSGLKLGTATSPGGSWEELVGACTGGSPTPCPTVVQIDTGASGGTAKLSPGQSVTFSLTATAPLTAGVYMWNIAAKPSSDFSGTSQFALSGPEPSVTLVSPPATSLSIAAPASATAGQPFSFTVTALNALNTTATGYAGTVQFTTSDTGSGVVLPANYKFTAADQGVHTFTNSATLTTAGTRLLTATDTVTSSITGTASIAVHAGAATRLVTSAPTSATAGSSIAVTVTAYDAFGNQATGYAGTVGFTSSDHGAKTQLPANYTFTSGDAGAHGFTAVLTTAGSQTITATDTVNSSLTSTASVTISPAAATAFQISGLPVSAAGAGTAFSATVTAVDSFGNTAIGYTGTVRFTTSDGNHAIVLPANYTFTGGDAGVHAFSGAFTLVTLGAQTITATDVANSAITGSGGVTVKPGPATQLAMMAVSDVSTGLTEPVKGQAFDVSVVSEDQFGNPSPVVSTTTITLTAGADTVNLSGTLTGAIPAGHSQGTINDAVYALAQNGVVLVVTATAGDTLSPTNEKVDVQDFAAVISGTPGVSVTLGSTQCTSPSPQLPTCATTLFQHGVKGKAFLSEGVCQGAATGCLANGTETSLLMNVTANMTDANGNPLYTRTDPAVTIVACDKSLCGGGNINKIPLFVDFNGTGTYIQVPACPAKSTIAPAPAPPFCVDYVTSHRDNAGDTLLYFDFASDYIIHY